MDETKVTKLLSVWEFDPLLICKHFVSYNPGKQKNDWLFDCVL